jgi:hypothetical protein
MFDDLDATMKALLDDPSAPADLRAADVSFDTPDRDYKPAQATINLFLHEVTENRALRDEARVMERVGDRYSARLPSLRVDCTYLTTAWSAQAGGLKAAEEHRLLGFALQWLSRFPVVEDRFVRGALKTPPQPYPLSTVVAQSREGRSNAEFWTALGVAPRPAFSVTVTLTVEPYDQVQEFAAVQDVRVISTMIPHAALAGRVLDHGLAPVTGAAVTVVETGTHTVSAANGQFVVPGLEFGAYTLRVQPTGGSPEQVAVTYAADHQLLTVVLSQP